MKYIAIFFITLYQKYISPYKGFRCAYASLYGGDSCSQAVKNILMAEGCINGFSMTQERFRDCRDANEELKNRRLNQACDCLTEGGCEMAEQCTSKQTGAFFDNTCEVPSCNMPSCDLPSCDIFSCDCSF